jgi:hypothetical protein
MGRPGLQETAVAGGIEPETVAMAAIFPGNWHAKRCEKNPPSENPTA